jgi:hypothetical protein
MNKIIISTLILSFHQLPTFGQEKSLLPWEKAELDCQIRRLNSEKKDLTCDQNGSELVKTLCENPNKFCAHFRDKAFKKGPKIDFANLDSRFYFDSNCKMFVGDKRKILESTEVSNTVADILKARTNQSNLPKADFEFNGHEEGIYVSDEWKKAKSQFEISRNVIINYLKNMNPPAPKVVIDRIINTKLFDPYDSTLSKEKKEEMFSSCSDKDDKLGAYNAFANTDGMVVICPKLLVSSGGDKLLDLFLHEISHLVGPCLMGNLMVEKLSPPLCDPKKSEDPEVQDLGQWVGRMKKLDKCFIRAGLNKGGDEKWIAKELTEIWDGPVDNQDVNKCPFDPMEFKRSKDPFEGHMSYCDPANVKMVVLVGRVVESMELESPIAKKINSLKQKITYLKMNVPDANQFNEAHADWLAARLLPEAMNEWSSQHKESPKSGQGIDIASQISKLCSGRYQFFQKKEAHPLDNDRMSIFTSQPEVREMLGCEGDPKFFSKRIGKCED